MPIYIYQDDRDSSIHEIVQSMNEEHVAFSKDGYQLKRIWSNPESIVSSLSNLNPNDNVAFVDATAARKGTIGDLHDLSAELSLKREKIYGKDPIKLKKWSDYEQLRGKKHPDERKELVKNATENVMIKINKKLGS